MAAPSKQPPNHRQSRGLAEYDLSTACRGLGNSTAIAASYHAKKTDSDEAFRWAFGRPESDPCSALQNAMQFSAANSRNEPKNENADVQKPLILRGFVSICESTQDGKLGAAGFEPA